jgi:hypothetical protein
MEEHGNSCREYVERTILERLPWQAVFSIPMGRLEIGYPASRWKDDINLETGLYCITEFLLSEE